MTQCLTSTSVDYSYESMYSPYRAIKFAEYDRAFGEKIIVHVIQQT